MRKVRIAWLPAVCLLGALTGCAPADGRSRGPLFDYRRTVLDNGLEVITLEDSSCPIVSVQMWYHVGSKDEREDRQGFAHMFEHMMFRGTDRLGPTDHFELIRRAGGSCNGYTGFDRTVYVQRLPANQLDLALWLEAERMSFLKIDQESFDTERKVVEEERRVGLNSPYGTVFEKVLAALSKKHPYRWSAIGNIAHLRATSVGELRDFWKRYYVPNNATLIVVGAVGHAEALRKARRYLGWIPRCDDPPRVTIREPQPTEPRTADIKEKNAPAPALAIIYRTVPLTHDDGPALELLGTILGGGASSRLYRELVAEKQLAVGAWAGDFRLEQDGVMVTGAVMSPVGGKHTETLEAIRAQVERLRDEPVSEKELTKARNRKLKSVVTGNLRISSKATLLGNAAVAEGDVSRVNDVLDRMRSVTPADIQRVARTYLTDERSLTVTIKRNLLGALFGKLFGGKDPEETAPVTGAREKAAPPPGREGVEHPADHPAEPPTAELIPPKVAPDFTTETLPNGLKVIVVENHEVPFISARLGLRGGAWTEAKPGAASMTMSMLTKGTARHTEGELAEELGTYAIGLWGGGGMNNCSVGANCLTEHAERMMKLMGEVVLAPTFPEDEFGKLRKQVRTDLAIRAESPSYLADRELKRRVYGDHPYARDVSGELKDVNALTVADLKEWWSAFARPDMAVLLLSGDIDHARAMQLARATFGEWKAAGKPPDVAIPDPPRRAATHIYLVNQPRTGQAQIRLGQLGIRRSDPGYFTTRVVNGYFSSGFGARLNKTVRVEKGLTYGIWGGYSPSRFAGRFYVGTFSKNASTADAVRAVLDEIRRLRTEGPSDDELSKVRSSMLGRFAGNRETPQAVAGDLWLIEAERLPRDHFEKMLAHVSTASARDCLDLIARTVDPEQMVIVVVGDASELKADLESIAPVTVVSRKPKAPKASDKRREGSGG